MILKEIDYKHPTDYENATHVEIPDEELWEDGELKLGEVFDKINYHLFVEGNWKLMRRKDNE